MVCEPERQKQAKQQERRKHRRLPARASAEFHREKDARRVAVAAEVANISMGGVGLVVSQKLEHGEQLKIRLRNEVQRYSKEVRGIVRWVQPGLNGKYQIGVELLAQLTSLDLQVLARQGQAVCLSESGKVWL